MVLFLWGTAFHAIELGPPELLGSDLGSGSAVPILLMPEPTSSFGNAPGGFSETAFVEDAAAAYEWLVAYAASDP